MEGKHVVTRTFPSLALVPVKPHDQKDVVPIETPIVSSYNDRIRPLLDTVDKLRNLSVMKEGIQLPTIVVVGDQSSGKSSVLESLAGISLPRGQEICTRVPLVMRLQQSSSPEPEIWLEYSGKVVPTDEEHITEAICAATDVIAGSGKGVSDAPLTHCKQRWFKIHEQTNNFNTATRRKPAAAGSQASSSNVENYERRPEGIKAAKAKWNNARSTNMKALAEYKSMWDIKKKDMAEKEKLQKLAILDTLLAKKEPLSATEEVIMSKIVSQYF